MKKLLMCVLCCMISLSMAACDNTNVNSSEAALSDAVASSPRLEPAAEETVNLGEAEIKNEMPQDGVEMGLAVNGTYYAVPSALQQFIADGWTISDQMPYFLRPMVGEDYYEIRTDWSLSQDGQGILPGGSIIRLLEKDGVLLEVMITNLAQDQEAEPYQKIEDGTVTSITVFYDNTRTSIQLNGKELNSITPEILLEDYPTEEGWTHAPNDYCAYPELGVSTDYLVMYDSGSESRSVEIYFDLDNIASKVQVVDKPEVKN